jgi:hypothetical protein
VRVYLKGDKTKQVWIINRDDFNPSLHEVLLEERMPAIRRPALAAAKKPLASGEKI